MTESAQKAEPQPDQTALLAQMTKILERVTAQPAAEPMGEEALTRILAAASKGMADATSEAVRKVAYPQNATHPHKSAFSYPEGDVARPKAELRRTVFFCGHREDVAQLTPPEIDLLNRFDRSRTAKDGRWVAEVKGNELHIEVPCKSLDDRMNLPALGLVLKELLDGEDSVNALSLNDRITELEARLHAAGLVTA